MDAIHQCLNRLADAKLATVVHVNPPDARIADRYLELGARRVVLVCGDPDAALAIKRGTQGRPAVEVVETAVSPTSGTAQWLRFNVREIDGLLEPSGGLRTFYPRLQLLERVPVAASSLQALLERLALELEDGRQNLLVLETPGLEDRLFGDLADPALRLLDWILVRGACDGLYEGGAGHRAVLQRLREHFYRPVVEDEDNDPLWPWTLLQYDAAAAERASLARRMEELEVQLMGRAREHEAQVEQLATARNEQAKLVAQHEAQLQAAAQAEAKSQALVEQLTAARDGLQVQVQALKQAKAEVERLAQDRLVQVDKLERARDDQAMLAVELQRRLDEVTKSKADLEESTSELRLRQRLMDEELIKAEGQIELIKDVLLREPGL
jgi:hypothetical protein